jgi:hypothetical protein
VARLFNAYMIVHWNAAAKATKGADSIWIGVMKRDVRFRLTFESHNPSTRAEAEALLTTLLEERAKRRERVLLGFDFPLGLPRGLAAGLKLSGDHPWRAVWDQLAKMVKDKTDNTNNRFGVGSEINRRLTGGPFPFWGCPPRDTLTTLQPRRGRDHGPGDIPEFRHVEAAIKSAQPVWKLYYNGAIGPQAILGIPMVRRMRLAFGEAMKVWPFETGWKALGENELAGVDVLAVEVSPSLVTPHPLPGEAREAALVRALAEHYAKQDEAGKLAGQFGPGTIVAEDVSATVQAEEGWALGV